MPPDPILLASEINRSLTRDVAQAWFPRCVDPEHGFHENFTTDWTPLPDESRSLVFQSRMIWFTAQMAKNDPTFEGYCRHGLNYFLTTILDEEGIPKMIFQAGGQDQTTIRSSYGMAFAIFGLANASQSLRDSEAVEAAICIFHHLERFHKDPKGRGYFEFTNLANEIQPLAERGETAHSLFKHQNPHLHLLEAFTDLYRVWPDPSLRIRLREIVDFFLEELFSEPGYLIDHVASDGTPADKRINFGHDVEVAHLVISASSVLGERKEVSEQVGIRLLDHALELGWDSRNGGLCSGVTGDGELNRGKIWWVQMENLLALATFYRLTGKEHYLLKLSEQWEWIRDHQIDNVNTGVFGVLDDQGQPIGRMPKGNTWKAAYHDGRALLQVPKILTAS